MSKQEKLNEYPRKIKQVHKKKVKEYYWKKQEYTENK